jgi:transposase
VRTHADAIRGCDTPVSLIAERLGVHRATVYRWLKADGHS